MDNSDRKKELNSSSFVPGMTGDDRGALSIYFRQLGALPRFTPEEIAQVIAPQFAETDLATITTIVTRYHEQDTWKEDLIFEEESFNLLQDILDSAGELSKRVPYKDLVNAQFAKEATK